MLGLLLYIYEIPTDKADGSYASSSEIQAYLKAVVLHFGLGQYVQFNSKVDQAVWHEQGSFWKIRVEGNGEYESEILINAGGILNHPKFPALKQLDAFQGEVIHTAAWDSGIDITDKRVAIVGAGASAIQILPALQTKASKIDIYIRTPSWITPPAGAKFIREQECNHIYTAEEIAQFCNDSDHSLRTRKDMESTFNGMYRAFFKDSEQQQEMQLQLESWMKCRIHNEELQKQLIPPFAAGCRRLNPGQRYLQALQQQNVEPIFEAIQEVATNAIRDASGKERPVDIIVAATGFDTSFRPRFPIIGFNAIDLRDLWKDDPVSYCGLAVSGFHNYLMFLGPNTPISNGSLIGALEATGDFFVRLIRKMTIQRATSFNVRQCVQRDFNDHTQKFMQGMVWTGGCRSWFKNEQGKVTAIWPGSGLHYREVLQSDRWEDFEWNYDSNRFAYWGLGFSQAERETVPDLSYYIRHHPNLPLEVLERVSLERHPSLAREPHFCNQLPEEPDTVGSEGSGDSVSKEQDNRSEQSTLSDPWDSSESDTNAPLSKQALISTAAAFSV